MGTPMHFTLTHPHTHTHTYIHTHTHHKPKHNRTVGVYTIHTHAHQLPFPLPPQNTHTQNTTTQWGTYTTWRHWARCRSGFPPAMISTFSAFRWASVPGCVCVCGVGGLAGREKKSECGRGCVSAEEALAVRLEERSLKGGVGYGQMRAPPSFPIWKSGTLPPQTRHTHPHTQTAQKNPKKKKQNTHTHTHTHRNASSSSPCARPSTPSWAILSSTTCLHAKSGTPRSSMA
jgi:hypothetical protein